MEESRAPAAPLPTVNWLELFYDVVIVAATIVFSHELSAHPSWSRAGWTAALFSLLWWAWLLTTLLVNADPREDAVRRGLIFAQMLVLALYTIVGGRAHDPDSQGVALLYALLLVVIGTTYAWTARRCPELSSFARHRRDSCLLAAALIALSAPSPEWLGIVLWLLGSALLVATVVTEFPVRERQHLGERLGALTIIMLGESFVKVDLTATTTHPDAVDVLVLCLELVIVCAMWLAYFLDIVPAGIAEERRTQRRWTLTHLPLHLATVALSVGVGSYLTLQPSSELSSAQIWVLAGPLAVIFLAFAALGWTAPRRPRSVLAALRITAALAIVVASLAMRGSGVDSVKVVVGVFGLVLIGYTASAAALRHRLATAR